MGTFNAFQDLRHQRDGTVNNEGPLLFNPLLQGDAVDIFKDQVKEPLMLTGLKKRDNVGVLQLANRAGFP